MAVDSRSKRSSAVYSRRLPWLRRFSPSPSGFVTSSDRLVIAYAYDLVPFNAVRVIRVRGSRSNTFKLAGSRDNTLNIRGSLS